MGIAELRENLVQNTITLTTTAETTLIAAQGAGICCDLTKLILSNVSASLVSVTIRDATTGTARLLVGLAASGGGAVIDFPTPFKQTTGNNNWTATLSGNASSVYVTAQAVKRN